MRRELVRARDRRPFLLIVLAAAMIAGAIVVHAVLRERRPQAEAEVQRAAAAGDWEGALIVFAREARVARKARVAPFGGRRLGSLRLVAGARFMAEQKDLIRAELAAGLCASASDRLARLNRLLAPSEVDLAGIPDEQMGRCHWGMGGFSLP